MMSEVRKRKETKDLHLLQCHLAIVSHTPLTGQTKLTHCCLNPPMYGVPPSIYMMCTITVAQCHMMSIPCNISNDPRRQATFPIEYEIITS